MIYLSLVLSLALGYLIGLIQNGINIKVGQDWEQIYKPEHNKSIGIDDYMEYYDETDGRNKF